jgi:hypothetical protein
MNKKIILFPLVGIICFSGLNYFPAAEAKHNKGNHGHNSKHFFHKNNVGNPHFRNNFFGRPVINKRPVYSRQYFYTRPPVIYRTQLVNYHPGTYYFYDRSPAYFSYSNARINGFAPSLFFSNGRWTLVIQ